MSGRDDLGVLSAEERAQLPRAAAVEEDRAWREREEDWLYAALERGLRLTRELERVPEANGARRTALAYDIGCASGTALRHRNALREAGFEIPALLERMWQALMAAD